MYIHTYRISGVPIYMFVLRCIYISTYTRRVSDLDIGAATFEDFLVRAEGSRKYQEIEKLTEGDCVTVSGFKEAEMQQLYLFPTCQTFLS